MKPEISVVIGAYHQKEVLAKTLDALFNQSLLPSLYEIIVVDSQSTDGTDELLKSLKPECGFRYFIRENEGKSGARNFGVSQALADIVLITDADMVADHQLIEMHLNAHKATFLKACFEGLTYNLNRVEEGIVPHNIKPYITRDYGNLAPLGWYYFLTGNLSFPKRLFEQAGGFSTDFTGYGWEDIELGYRFFKQRIPLFYLKTAMNYHFHDINPIKVIDRNFDKGQSARVFLAKHPEQKLFLGINPISVGLFRLLQRKPTWLAWFKNNLKNHQNINLKVKISTYIVGEFEYLSGLLQAP